MLKTDRSAIVGIHPKPLWIPLKPQPQKTGLWLTVSKMIFCLSLICTKSKKNLNNLRSIFKGFITFMSGVFTRLDGDIVTGFYGFWGGFHCWGFILGFQRCLVLLFPLQNKLFKLLISKNVTCYRRTAQTCVILGQFCYFFSNVPTFTAF